MKCDKVKELLLTDYIDGELDPETLEEVTNHLKECASCRELEQELRGGVVEPLRESGIEQPSEAVWLNIKGRIEEETENPLVEALRKARETLTFRRPALAIVSAVALLLIVSAPIAKYYYDRNAAETYLEEQISFFDALNNGSEWLYEDIGIPDENIFL
jgi:anti-sigma factor RsiW